MAEERPVSGSPSFTESDAEDFFVSWAAAARAGDRAWFEENLSEKFHTSIVPIGAALGRAEFLDLIDGPADIDFVATQVWVRRFGRVATATIVAEVREDLTDGPLAGSTPFVAALARGASLVYQAAFEHGAGRWRCTQQTIAGLQNARQGPEIPGAWLEEQGRGRISQALVAQWRATIAALLERQALAGDGGESA